MRMEWFSFIISRPDWPTLFACLCLSVIFVNPGLSNDLNISNIRVVDRSDIDPDPVSVIFDLSWQNAWNNDKNHDAAWVFVKFNSWNTAAKLDPQRSRVLENRITGCPDLSLDISPDSLGFFVYASSAYRGAIDVKVKLVFDTSTQQVTYQKTHGKFDVYGIEMVYIPTGPFVLGSPDNEAISRASFYAYQDDGSTGELYRVTSENEMEVGQSPGDLYYWSEAALYNGDQKGPIPSAFPKGYNDFYIMKYELTQGQYADFLNALSDNDSFIRSPIGGKNYYDKRGGIRFEDGKYTADNPHRPMNHVSFTDGLAFTDWAYLRPITELEYEKAARGPTEPQPFEFVWGTDNYDRLARYVTGADLTLAYGYDESMLNDQNRDVFGASYYWVMDLSGSVWEKVITVGNPIGRSFEGTHGDGNLDFGEATNEDWPRSDNEVGGFGYRGGGYYNPGTEYSDFNPHSPIGYRYYGAWSGGPRYIAYGYRAGRTAP